MTDTSAIPFVDLTAQYRRLGSEIDARIRAVLDHRRFIMGPEVAELEAALADFAGVGYAVGVSSGTDALLMAFGWEGDMPAVNKAEAEPTAYGDAEPLAVECSHFLDCVARGTQPDSDAAEGTRVLEVLDACHRSPAEGRTVDLGEKEK